MLNGGWGVKKRGHGATNSDWLTEIQASFEPMRYCSTFALTYVDAFASCNDFKQSRMASAWWGSYLAVTK